MNQNANAPINITNPIVVNGHTIVPLDPNAEFKYSITPDPLRQSSRKNADGPVKFVSLKDARRWARTN